jgi:hypothetical protein
VEADSEVEALPGLIKTQFRFVDFQFARVRAELADLRTEVAEMRTLLEDRFDAILRAVAEAITERDKGG